MHGSKLLHKTSGWLKGYTAGYKTAARAANRNPLALILRGIFFLLIGYGLSILVTAVAFHFAMKNVSLENIIPLKTITKYEAYNEVYDYHPKRRTAQ